MPAYVALLRGIAPMNPNMRNQKLREVFEGLGFTKVQTVISSGNVLFETDKTDQLALETLIEQAIVDELGFTSATIIRSQAQLQALVEARPFKGAEHSKQTYLTITFLKTPLPAPARMSSGKDYKITHTTPAEVCAVTNVDQLHTPDFMMQLEKQFGKTITTRTWKTVERILAKF